MRPSTADGDSEATELEEPLLMPSDAPVAPAGGRMRAAVLLALAGMVGGTVVQSEASQALQSHEQFNKPFFITCFNHTLIAVLLPLLALYDNLVAHKATGWQSVSAVVRQRSVLPMDRLVTIAVFVSVASLMADYFWYAALAGVSVTAANAISNCSPLFVYCFSICLLHEKLALEKLTGVLLAFVGVTFIVMYQDPTHRFDIVSAWHNGLHDASVLAGLLIVVSSVFYAAYQVVLKVLVGNELTDTATVVLIQALAGVYTIPMWIVGSVVVAHSPVASLREPFGLPTTPDGRELLVLSGTLSIGVNVCMPLLLCWTTPLETSVAAMLVVPLAGVWDVVFHHTRFSAECIFGSVLVLVGFGMLEYYKAVARSTEAEAETETSSQPEASVLLPSSATISETKQSLR